MKKYVFEIVIHEGSDEFWEESTAEGKTGCDEVLEYVSSLIRSEGFDESNTSIKLVSYVDRE